MQLILNELSSQFPLLNQYQARGVMTSFLRTYILAMRATGSNQLVLDRDYNHIKLAKDYCIEQWRNDIDVDVEDKRIFRSLIQRSITYDSFPIENLSEFKVQSSGHISYGCLLAYVLFGCCLSFLCDGKWDVSLIDGEYSFLNEETEQIQSKNVSIPNIASELTATAFSQAYCGQINHEKCTSFIVGEDILRRRKEFPNVVFCKNAEAQLKSEHSRNNVGQIVKHLLELQKYFETAEGAFNPQQLKHCTQESENTLDTYNPEHTFVMPNGEKKLFSWHIRFTGDYAGRIFFYPDMVSKKCYIGHIGHKLPTVDYPT